MRITSKINMDLLRPAHPVVINAVQGDQNTRCLEISLYSGGAAWQIPAGATAAMRYCKADKTKGYYDTMPDGTTAWSVSGNVISVLLAPQMLTAPGTVLAQVELLQGTMILGTWIIQISVTPNPAAGVLVSEDYINWLQWIEGELDEYLEKVKANSEILGGTVVGPINMNGQALTGLNAPTSADGAANKGYVDDSKAEAVTEAKNYVNEQVRMARPRNLLDNSDFTNPVNQRGYVSDGEVAAYSYFLDRWVNGTSEARSFKLSDNGISLPAHTTLLQRIERISPGTIVTFVAELSDGTKYMITAAIAYNADGSWIRLNAGAFSFGDLYIETMYGYVNVVIYTNTITPNTLVKNTALYEGEYTTETLPEYQPKGHAVELAECQRYYRKAYGVVGRSNEGYDAINFDAPMRITPTVTITAASGGTVQFYEASQYYISVQNVTNLLEQLVYTASADL